MDHIVTHINEIKSPTDHTSGEDGAFADLVYVSSLETGISRRQGKNGFLYYDEAGRRVTQKPVLDRIASLGIPPAYVDVIISPDPRSHLQATGRDAKGRKQYRYHPDWSEGRGNTKFSQLVEFAAALPDIRERVDSDLRLRKPGPEKALATVVWLLDKLFIRVGNATYAKENGSFGLTTLRNRHVKIDGSTVHFNFKGKSGKEWRLSHHDRRITNAIRTLQELPGQQLFQYLDEDGQRHPVRSQDVNDYIRSACGGNFSSRQFRTWGASRMAAIQLAQLEPCQSSTECKRMINSVIDNVASTLVNTRAVCRNSYIHPKIIDAFADGDLRSLLKIRPSRSVRLNRWMEADEIRVMRWLESH
ncbi:DNA topoisomerase IB [Agrobacterium tumefaciens]|uniref:DNA topoisomerase IB n=1 Tax=Agrobacterium tumefaciens TaxID=358 RepID=UPI00287C1E09|nr:DNA topoisomerase IB [Agrobacterium tumefaciens]MDS7594361.1 DNA topoisomerase IB [Agrobacterium tumefaciens]